MKKIYLLVIILLLVGCTKYEELNDLAIISNITISKINNEYNIVMQEIKPKNSDNKIDYNYKYRRSNSKELKKAFKNIINHSPKKIYLNKVQNIIISNTNSNEIINSFIKYAKEEKTFNKDLSIVIAKNDLDKILKVNSDYRYIDSILKNKKTTLKGIIKKKKIKVPIIKIYNKELIFYKYNYLQLYP